MNLFITPTAIRRFGERVRALHPEEITDLLQRAADHPQQINLGVRDDGTLAVTVRVKNYEYQGRRYSFRFVIVRPERPGGLPVVATVLQGSVDAVPPPPPAEYLTAFEAAQRGDTAAFTAAIQKLREAAT